MYICSCSGGKDSIATVILAHEHNEPLDLIVFVEVMFDDNISGELPEHIDFIKNRAFPLFESWGYATKIIQSPITYMQWFNKETVSGRYAGTGKIRGFTMANHCGVNRDLKSRPLNRFFKSLGEYTSYVGIAADEEKRLSRITQGEFENQISLLAKYGYTEVMARELCDRYGLLSPIYQYTKRGGCFFCPNAKERELRHLRTNYRELWDMLLELETKPNLIGNMWNTLTQTRIYDIEQSFMFEDLQFTFDML